MRQLILLSLPFGYVKRYLPIDTVRAIDRNHKKLGLSLYSYLASAIDEKAMQAYGVHVKHGVISDGWQVIQEIMSFHHPRLPHTTAHSYTTTKDKSRPIMQEREGLQLYYTKFDTWHLRLSLYHEYRVVRGSEISMWFLQGLATWDRLQLQSVFMEIMNWQQHFRAHPGEDELPMHLTYHHFYHQLIQLHRLHEKHPQVG